MSLTQVTTGGVDENINIDSNTLKVDGTNNRVGIGTASPSHKLVVSQNNSGGIAAIHLPEDESTILGSNANTNIKMGGNMTVSAGGVLGFNTNGSERARINSSGRLLVGTTTEGHVSADNFTVADSGHCGITIRSGTTSEGAIYFSDGTSGDAEYRGQVLYDHDGDYMRFSTAVTERLRITSSGRMGLGITSPQQRQHIHEGSSAASVTQYTNSVTGSTANDGLLVGLDSTEDGLFWIKEAQNLTFGTANAERMRIDSSGRLLSGTSSTSFTTRAVFHGSSSGSGAGGSIVIARDQATPSNGAALGTIFFSASNHSQAARIGVARDGGTWTPGSSQPSRMEFATTADGSSSPREHFRLSSSGRLSGNAIAIERVFGLLYSRLASHSGCSSNGPSAVFTNFDDSEPAFKVVGRTVTAAPTNYRFIGNDSGEAFSFFVSCADQVAFATHNASADAPSYRSWVCCHEDFLNALAGLPNNSTRTSLP